jgi:hypothetical protein
VIDARLEPGAISEVVTVTGASEAALVEKDTVQISATYQQKKIQDLPINVPGGGIDRVALLVPGVTVGFGNVNGIRACLAIRWRSRMSMPAFSMVSAEPAAASRFCEPARRAIS